MNKEEQIQELKSKQLIDELSKMPPMVIATAYLHALNYTLYGEDVTEKWITATQQASALEEAYKKGYYDAKKEQVKNLDLKLGCKYFNRQTKSCGKGYELDCDTCSHFRTF